MNWQTYFTVEPCPDGWEAFIAAFAEGGLEHAVRTASLGDRIWGAENAHHAGMLRNLATDPDARVRWHVAGNTSTPPDALAEMRSDPDAWVRAYLAGNPNTPPQESTP